MARPPDLVARWAQHCLHFRQQRGRIARGFRLCLKRPRYNYGKISWDIPSQYVEKRERPRAVAAQFGADLRTAAPQFSAADVAAALIVGAHTEAQVLANVTSMQATTPPEFWAELKRAMI